MKKIIFSVLVVAGLLFNLPVQALTASEIQDMIAKLQQQIAELQKQLPETPAVVVWCHDFNTNLRIGDGGDGGGSTGIHAEVKALIEALSKEGVLDYDQVVRPGSMGSSIRATDFSEEVAAAVVAFQEKYRGEILTPFGLKRGTGFVGKSTRAKLNQLYGCIVPPIPVSRGVPVIDGVEGPSILKLNEEGTWTIKAHDPEKGSLRYSVDWGDNRETPIPLKPFQLQEQPQTTTFTHQYSSTGIYTVRFTVTDTQGLSAKSSITVNVVSKETKNSPPRITSEPGIPEVLRVNEEMKFVWAATDPDLDDMSWSVLWGDGTEQASGCEIRYGYSYYSYTKNPTGSLYEARHAWSKAGVYTVTVSVNDCGKGGSDSYSFKVNVVGDSTNPSITVISPNGGETFVAGQKYPIDWRSTNIDRVKISLCADTPLLERGFTCHLLSGIPDAGISASTGSFIWSIDPNHPFIPCNSGCKIHLSAVGSDAFDYSDNYFSIVSSTVSKNLPDLMVYAGKNSASAQVGQDVLLSFVVKNQGSVGSYAPYIYSEQADGRSETHYSNTCWGSTYLKPGEGCTSAYNFRFNSAGTKKMVVKVDPYSQIEESDESNNVASLELNVLSSTSAYPGFFMSTNKSSYALSDQIDLTLRTANGSFDRYSVDLYALKDMPGGYGEQVRILSNIGVSQGSALVSFLPKYYPVFDGAGKYLLLICPSSVGCSGGTNSIYIEITQSQQTSVSMISPNGGETWKVGEAYPITWKASSDIQTVFFTLEDASRTHVPGTIVIGSAQANAGTYSWKVGQFQYVPQGYTFGPGSKFKILVSGNGISDTSDNDFSIVNTSSQVSFKILSPNGGENLEIGKPYTVKWSSTGNVANVHLDLYRHGAYEIGIVGETPNTGSWVWNVPSSPVSWPVPAGSGYSLRIFSLDNRNNWDESDNYFNIVSSTGGGTVSPTSDAIQDVENGLASISSAISKLLESFKNFVR